MNPKRKTTSHPVDKHVGVKLRQKRILSGLSQEDIGKALGLTFQQIQKYESGLNRISCSRLYELSVYLNVPINYFFEGFIEVDEENSAKNRFLLSEIDTPSNHFIEDKEIMNLVKSYSSIEDEKIRKKILSLIKVFFPLEDEEPNKYDKMF